MPEALWLGIEMAAERYTGCPGDVAQERAAVIKSREQRRADLRARLEHLDGIAKMPAWTRAP